MDVEQNREVIRQHYARRNRGDWKAAIEDYAEDARNHGRPVGREGMRRVLEDIYATFPDWRMDIVEMVAEANAVIVRCTVGGTHRGVGRLPLYGGLLLGVPPTGKRFEAQQMHWYALRAGQIVDHRATRDDIGMMQQLGLLPPVARPDTGSS